MQQLTPHMAALNEVIAHLRRPTSRGYKYVDRDADGRIIGARETFEPFNGRILAAEGARLVNELDAAGLKGERLLLAMAISAEFLELAAPYVGLAEGASYLTQAQTLKQALGPAGAAL